MKCFFPAMSVIFFFCLNEKISRVFLVIYCIKTEFGVCDWDNKSQRMKYWAWISREQWGFINQGACFSFGFNTEFQHSI